MYRVPIEFARNFPSFHHFEVQELIYYPSARRDIVRSYAIITDLVLRDRINTF